MDSLITAILLSCVCVAVVNSQTTTTLANQCTWTDYGVTPIFECDFSLITLPLYYSQFTPLPQRLKIFNVNGQLPYNSPTPSFTGWSSFTTGSIDSNYPVSLEIVCTSGGSLILFAGTFTDMSHVQEVKISNCLLAGGLPNNVFSDFVELDSLIIDGGSITGLNYGALSGLNISTNLNIPSPKGLFAMTNLEIDTTTFPAGFFYPIDMAHSIILDNIATPTTGYLSMPKDTFTQNTAMKVK